MTLRTLICCSIVSLALPFAASAQLKCPPIAGGDQDGKYNVTVGGGPTLLYGDIKPDGFTSNMGYGVFLKGDYRLYKGLFVGLEGQFGKLKATGNTDTTSVDWDPREASNSYYAGFLNVTVFPYRFFISERDLMRKGFVARNILNGLYIGAGAGAVFNNYKFNDVTRVGYEDLIGGDANGPKDVGQIPVLDGAGAPILDGDRNPVMADVIMYKKKTKSVILPVVNIGLSVPINKDRSMNGRYFSAVLNSQFNFSGDEDLDGFDPLGPDGMRRSGAKNDMYNFTSIGLKYTF